MKQFNYKVKDVEAKTLTGAIEARDEQSAIQTLRDKNYVVISIHENHSGSSLFAKFISNRVGSGDVVTFTRQLATMINSGLPVTEALSILELQSSPGLSRVISEVIRDVQGGSTISEAMIKHKNVFSGVYISLIKAGEASGKLSEVLERLASNLEKQREFSSKTKGALVYPAIVSVGMIVVAIIMMIFVIPKLTEMYADFEADLPLPTMILIGISNFMLKFWPFMIGVIVVGVYLFNRWHKTPKGVLAFDAFLLRMPVFGKLRRSVLMADMTRTMGMLIGSGISIIESIEIVQNVVGNKLVENGLADVVNNIRKGMPLSVALSHHQIFPPLISNMVSVGEETGKLDEVLIKVSRYFEEESEHLIKGLTTALEPLIMVVLGLGVGFLVIAIIMPIYNLTNEF